MPGFRKVTAELEAMYHMMKALLLGCISLGGIHIQIGRRALECSTLPFSPLSDLRQQINLEICMIYYLLKIAEVQKESFARCHWSV